MIIHNNKPYITPRSGFLGVELEGITCVSGTPGDNGDVSEGELSLHPTGDPFVDPFFDDVFLK
jgi:hypothetical protein